MKRVVTTSNPIENFDYETTLEACARGEHAALRAIYERDSPWLLAVAMRIVRDRHTAHDILQDAFLQIWLRAGTYQRSLGSARGWVFTVVRHRALDEIRRLEREQTVAGDIDEPKGRYAELNEQLEPSSADAAVLKQCLDQLDARKRECIIYAFVEGYTYEEIAKRLVTPAGTVKSWIRRGLISLKACLS